MTARPDLRRRLRDQRRAIAPAARIAAAEGLAAQLFALPSLPTRGYVAGYWASDGEIGLHVMQMRLPAGLVYCLPVLHGDALRFAPWRPGQPLTSNRYGIPEPDVAVEDTLEPERMALVVTPLVGFDAQCRRLGMGGGWYDRSFAFRHDRPAPPWLVGAAFAVQQVESLPVASWDVPVDAICTEDGTLFPSAAPVNA